LYNLFTTKLPDVQKDPSGLVATCEIQRILRWLGYCPSQHRFYDFMDQYFSEDTDHLDLTEFIKLVADYRYANIGMARPKFLTLLPQGDKFKSIWKNVSIEELEELLCMCGHRCATDDVNTMVAASRQVDGCITWQEFLRLEGLYRSNLRDVLKNNQGFTPKESSSMANRFSKYTVKNAKHILFTGFEKLAKDIIPQIVIDASVRELVKESDFTCNNKMEFAEFLWIMRRLCDRDTKATMSRAKRLREELGYHRSQIQDLRELFNAVDLNLSGTVDMAELKVLFSGLVDLNEAAEDDLNKFIRQVGPTSPGDLDFFEFLMLMKKLENINWRNIVGNAVHQIHREASTHRERSSCVSSDVKRKSLFVSQNQVSMRGAGHDFML
jgi:Ca2+-binding EF-hand superfamily protein